MYFQESANILSENQELREQIIALDEHLFINKGGYVRLEHTADLLEIEAHILQNLIDEYLAHHVISSTGLPICSKCDVPIEEEGDPIRCDICDRQFAVASLKNETVYHPRETLFESGDEISKEIPTSYDVEGVFKVAGCSNDDRVADVIFVHGLGGDAKQTWHPDDKPESFWPKWIHEKLPDVGVWSLEYEAAKTKWTGDALALPDRAADVLERLSLAGLGSKPIVFVVHSLGGLVVKEALKRGNSDNVTDWKDVATSVRGVMFIATPHSGSDLSKYMSYISAFARSTAAIEDLEPHHPRLRESNVWFRNNVADLNIRVRVLFETKPTKKFGLGALVVDQSSADPGIAGVAPTPIEADHVEICKPADKSSLVFLHSIRLIERVIADNPIETFTRS